MKVNLPGRLRNVALSSTRPLQPLFEAIVNSIQHIQELELKNGKIDITVFRDESQTSLIDQDIDTRPITGFRITDNGSGFNKDNYDAFCESDTTHKTGARGIGRLLWLKAFEAVKVESVYQQNGGRRKRRFDFRLSDTGVEKHIDDATNDERETTVELLQYKTEFGTNCPKSLDLIGDKIIEHCLIYFLAKDCPRIAIKDTKSRCILNEQYEKNVKGKSETIPFKVVGRDFNLISLRLYLSDEKKDTAYFCADDRAVISIDLGKRIPNLRATLLDEQGKKFKVAAYISSAFLNESVNAERTNFHIDKDKDIDGIFADSILTFEKIEAATVAQIQKHLEPYLKPIVEDKLTRITRYVREKAPEYRSIVRNRSELLEKIQPGLSDDKLDLELHKLKYQVGAELKEQAREILSQNLKDVKNIPEYFESYNKYIEEISDVSRDSLAEYVIHRKSILSLLDKSLGLRGDGKYEQEDVIHRIIYPKGVTSDDIDPDNQNLWIIDERLSFHTFLASDKAISSYDVISSSSQKEPDLAIFNKAIAYVGSKAPISSVVIVELKRPMRKQYGDNDEEKNPVLQVLDYIKKIRNSEAIDMEGRQINVSKNAQFYAYIIADLTPRLRGILDNFNFTETPDGMGYFLPHKSGYIEAIDYEKLITDAKKRNRVLFERLNLPTD